MGELARSTSDDFAAPSPGQKQSILARAVRSQESQPHLVPYKALPEVVESPTACLVATFGETIERAPLIPPA